MILGFILLSLVFIQYYIAEICIPDHVADTMLPCRAKAKNGDEGGNRRRLLACERRELAGEKKPACKEGVQGDIGWPIPCKYNPNSEKADDECDMIELYKRTHYTVKGGWLSDEAGENWLGKQNMLKKGLRRPNKK